MSSSSLRKKGSSSKIGPYLAGCSQQTAEFCNKRQLRKEKRKQRLRRKRKQKRLQRLRRRKIQRQQRRKKRKQRRNQRRRYQKQQRTFKMGSVALTWNKANKGDSS